MLATVPTSLELILSSIVEEKANRQGRDVRPGQRFRVVVESAPDSLVECGQVIQKGRSEILVHEDDLPALRGLVETATEEQMSAVRMLHASMCADAERDPRKHGSRPTTQAAFREIMRRDMRPLTYLSVIEEPKAADETKPRAKG